jgi:pilus assembly protein CpaB
VNRRALLASVVCASLGVGSLEIYKRRLVVETSGGDPVAVLIVTRDVPIGGAVVKDALGVRNVPEAYVEKRQVPAKELEKIVGARVSLGLKASEGLLWTDLVAARPESRDLSSLVQPGMRAVSVRAVTFDGLLRPGDRVDVMPRDAKTDSTALQNLLVLAVGSDTGSSDDPAARPASGSGVTLSGSVEQATALAALRGSDVTLALRNPDDGVLVDSRTATAAPPVVRRGAATSELDHVR